MYFVVIIGTFGMHLPKEDLGCEYIGVLEYVLVNSNKSIHKESKFCIHSKLLNYLVLIFHLLYLLFFFLKKTLYINSNQFNLPNKKIIKFFKKNLYIYANF